MNTKSLRVQVKDADKGLVEAVFATFDVVDLDGDVTLKGAFDDGAPVRISAFGHGSWSGLLPVGKGVIRTTDTEAVLEGNFFMNTAHGRDTFETVKQLGDLAEWSYSLDDVEAEYGEMAGKSVRYLKRVTGITEVSPVLRGAGIGTRTLAVKGQQTFVDEATAVLAAVASLGERAAGVMAMRAEKGKGLGAESAALLGQVEAQLEHLRDVLTPVPSSTADAEREYLRFVAGKFAMKEAA